MNQLIKDAYRGEAARRILEAKYRQLSGDTLWSVRDLSVAELLLKLKDSLNTKK